MLSTLLVIDTSICAGFECPFTLAIVIYVTVAILACCCCYPGACLCAERFRNPKSKSKVAAGLQKLNLLGSIGEVLENELKPKDVVAVSSGNNSGVSLVRKRPVGSQQINY